MPTLFKGIVLCKTKADYDALTKDPDKLYIIEDEAPVKLYHGEGQNTDGAIDQKVVTDALAVKADLVDGKVPSTQLPAFVDDVLEYPSLSSFPATGESGKIYVALDTNKTYRWSGSTYVEISPSIALGETESTAYRGDRGKIAYDHSSRVDNPHNVTKAQLGLQYVDNTRDEDKPVSGPQQDAIDAVDSKIDTHLVDTSNPHSVTKAQVGLGNVDNTADADKPVSNAQALAIRVDSTNPDGTLTNGLLIDLTQRNSSTNATARMLAGSTYNVPSDFSQGVRYVNWIAANHVNVMLVGEDTSSKPGVWINAYYNGWEGWRRIDTDTYDATPVTAFGAINGSVIYARVTYQRTGYKKGIISMSAHINANSLSSNFTFASLSTLGSLLGVSFKNPSSGRLGGKFLPSADAELLCGYSAEINIGSDGNIQLGRRYYSGSSYDFGGWPLSTLGGSNGINYLITDIYVEEN